MKKLTMVALFTAALLLSACGTDTKKKTASTPSNDSNTTQTTTCTASGTNVLVDEGKTCTYNGHTAKCSNSRVTVDNALSAGSGGVEINGLKFICQ